MAQSSKSIKLTDKQKTDLTAAVNLIENHLNVLAPTFLAMPPSRRAAVLEHSPILRRIIALVQPYVEAH